MNFKQHRENWNECTCCSLCLTRKHVVLARGSIPADILMVGEAPGKSEDIHGQPFYGPAGDLLNKIVAKAKRGRDVKFAFTNLVACLPIGADGKNEPEVESIEACSSRLEEFVELSNPKGVILVGKLSEKHFGSSDQWITKTIVHPASILRSDLSQQGLLVQNCVVTISDMIEELGF